MPRFHFHVHDGSDFRDDEGTEFANVEQARQNALRLAGDLLREHREFWNKGKWTMDVADTDGLILFSLMFVAIEAPASNPVAAP